MWSPTFLLLPTSPSQSRRQGGAGPKKEEEEKEFFDYLIGRPMLASGGTS